MRTGLRALGLTFLSALLVFGIKSPVFASAGQQGEVGGPVGLGGANAGQWTALVDQFCRPNNPPGSCRSWAPPANTNYAATTGLSAGLTAPSDTVGAHQQTDGVLDLSFSVGGYMQLGWEKASSCTQAWQDVWYIQTANGQAQYGRSDQTYCQSAGAIGNFTLARSLTNLCYVAEINNAPITYKDATGTQRSDVCIYQSLGAGVLTDQSSSSTVYDCGDPPSCDFNVVRCTPIAVMPRAYFGASGGANETLLRSSTGTWVRWDTSTGSTGRFDSHGATAPSYTWSEPSSYFYANAYGGYDIIDNCNQT